MNRIHVVTLSAVGLSVSALLCSAARAPASTALLKTNQATSAVLPWGGPFATAFAFQVGHLSHDSGSDPDPGGSGGASVRDDEGGRSRSLPTAGCTRCETPPGRDRGFDECNDFDPCTKDICLDGCCVNSPLYGVPCNDGDACTTDDTCEGGECVGTPLDCDDADPCTWDTCEIIEAVPTCLHYAIDGGDCDDNDPCTEDDHCVVISVFEAVCVGSEMDCDDDNECTDDRCDDGECLYDNVPLYTPCGDGDSCTMYDMCVQGVCVGTTFLDCDDENPCTDEDCSGGDCIHSNNSRPCDDQDACTEDDTCSGGSCQGTPMNCDDGDICTTDLGCDTELGCLYEDVCDDGDPCTYNHCDPASGDCEYEPWYPPFDRCAQYGWTVTTGPPPDMVFVNNDDDNGNGVRDWVDTGPVTGEDDLEWWPFAVYGGDVLPGCYRELSSYMWSADPTYYAFRFYSDSEMSGGVHGVGGPLPSPSGLYVCGRMHTSACGLTAFFGVYCGASYCGDSHCGHFCHAESSPVVVVKVDSLEWRVFSESPGNPELDDCPNNGGLRIFPGKTGPNDNGEADRRKVDLVATIAPPIEGVEVHFRVWDIDDPFDQNNPGMPGVEVIDDDAVGGDNRIPSGADPALVTDSAETDANGEARLTITVSMQPGNNYRAGASCLEDALNQPHGGMTMQQLADSITVIGYSVPLVWSPMLTVWRKLHVEIDSMARPTFGQNTIDTEWNQPGFPPPGGLVLDIGSQHGNDHFENGFIRIKAAGFPDLVTRIITFVHSVGDDEVVTSITPEQWGGRPTTGSHPCTISDDDLAEEDTFTAGVVGCDMGTGEPPNGFLLVPNTTELCRHYKPAYIAPEVQSEHTSLGAFPFVKNMTPETASSWDPARLVLRGLPVSTPDFWTVYVLSAFQAERHEDYDGETFATKGISTHEVGDTTGKWGSSYTGLCAIFLEGLRECCLEVQQRITISHEIAHTLGADHTATGLMHATTQTSDFSAESLAELREYQGP